MKKLFIIIYDSASTGKTTALNAARTCIENRLTKMGIPYTYELLWGTHGCDFRGYFSFKEYKVGVSSAGDDAGAVKNGLDNLGPICDVVVLATRTWGQTVNEANDTLAKLYPDSEVVWLSKEYLSDIATPWTKLTLPIITSLMARHAAESITEIIHILRPNIF